MISVLVMSRCRCGSMSIGTSRGVLQCGTAIECHCLHVNRFTWFACSSKELTALKTRLVRLACCNRILSL